MTCPSAFLGFGAGLRREHYDAVLAGAPGCDWFEAISENYMATAGRPLAVLERVRTDRPVALHGVGLSIGGTDPLDHRYLHDLRALASVIEPSLVTDHLCWTGVGGRVLHDLLPLPYTEESLAHVVERVGRVQDALGRRIALENPTSYVAFRHSTIAEGEFLSAVAEAADCWILLDVNNVHVSAFNLGFDPAVYIDTIAADRVVQIHLAGFTDCGDYLFDTHGTAVSEPVWELYARALRRFGPVSTLVEWDADIPGFDRLCGEVARARAIAEDLHDCPRPIGPETAGHPDAIAAVDHDSERRCGERR